MVSVLRLWKQGILGKFWLHYFADLDEILAFFLIDAISGKILRFYGIPSQLHLPRRRFRFDGRQRFWHVFFGDCVHCNTGLSLITEVRNCSDTVEILHVRIQPCIKVGIAGCRRDLHVPTCLRFGAEDAKLFHVGNGGLCPAQLDAMHLALRNELLGLLRLIKDCEGLYLLADSICHKQGTAAR